jgi:hypothetical protein
VSYASQLYQVRRECPRVSTTRRPLVADITNAASFTCSLLLALQLCTPHAILARRYRWIGGASEDHQKDYGCEESKAKAHIMPYEPGACLGTSFLPLPHIARPHRQRQLGGLKTLRQHARWDLFFSRQ